MTDAPTFDENDTHAIDSLINQRPRILGVKLAVFATQIQERLRVRSQSHLRIASELGLVRQQLAGFEEAVIYRVPFDIALRNFAAEQQSKLTAEQRHEDAACWRDIAQVMTDFLSTWEALEQSEVRGDFVRAQAKEDLE